MVAISCQEELYDFVARLHHAAMVLLDKRVEECRS